MNSPQAIPSTRALIDVSAFRHNLDAVRSYIDPRTAILAVVKANAYGHGAERLAAEAENWGVDALGVARINEGVDLRTSGIRIPILVFEAAPVENLRIGLEHGLELTVVSAESGDAIDAEAGRIGTKGVVHLKVDTGMGRLGFSGREVLQQIERVARLKHLQLKGLYSHFATSEDQDRTYATGQLERFQGLTEELGRRGVHFQVRHMANSGAIIGIPGAHLDMVRPGIMLYGYPPAREMIERFPVRPVMSLVSRVAQVKEVEAGTDISYGRKYRTSRRTLIATIPIGYADGLSRLMTGKAEVLIGGKRYPVVGTICMDAVMVDLQGFPEVRVGEPAVFIGLEGGNSIDAWEVASRTGTIPYEVTSLITQRVPRVFQG